VTVAHATTVRRVDFGHFLRPATETRSGQVRAEPVLGYLVRHRDGVLLFDTGMGMNPEIDAHYRPTRVPLPTAVPDLADVTMVANCHLHFDHCGGNPQLTGRPVFTQRHELTTARSTADYTLPQLLDGGAYEELDGAAEVLPGVTLLPTPGHTGGHQSLVVRLADGTVVLAGQSHDSASDFAADALAGRHHAYEVPPWMEQLLALDPRRIVFAHDHAVWES
jgi:N-acyl homoserine lactone hydrolase